VILILLAGAGLAALRESNELWDSSVFSVTLVILLISVLLGIYRINEKRAFWIGFALFGWIYLGLTLMPSIESRLITTQALGYLDSVVPRSISDRDFDGWLDLSVANNWLVRSPKGPLCKTGDFVRIGHSLLALIAACVGGLLCRRLDAGNRSPVSRPVNPPA
jgi:hypothetical protein